jgi:hypothetical protein
MWSVCASFALLSLYSVPIHAFTSFETDCTLPRVSYNYLSAPNVRSTLDITWSSLATIIACTFTVLHLNVPDQRDGRDPGWTGDLKWWWKNIQPTLQWTAITIVAPEWYALNAINTFWAARGTRNSLRSMPRVQHPHHDWTLVQAFYINMGGYAIRLPGRSASKIPQSAADERGALTHLGARSFCQISRQDMHDSDRLLSDADIADRSKSDALAKCLAVVQVLYFCTSHQWKLVHWDSPSAPSYRMAFCSTSHAQSRLQSLLRLLYSTWTGASEQLSKTNGPIALVKERAFPTTWSTSVSRGRYFLRFH